MLDFLREFWPLFLIFIGINAFVILTKTGPSMYRASKVKNAQEEQFEGTLTKIRYETGTGYMQPQIKILADGEKRARVFETMTYYISKIPEEGTRVTVTCKGPLILSMRWDGGEISFYADEEGSGYFPGLKGAKDQGDAWVDTTK